MSEEKSQNTETKSLAKVEERPAVPMAAGVQLHSFDALQRFATMVAASGLAPKDMTRMETIAIAIEMGLEVGLKPMQALQNIAVVNGRPSLWGDAALALVEASGLLEDHSETWTGKPYEDDFKAVVTTKRRGRRTPTVRDFSVADAKTAGLWKKAGPWSTNPKRMLQMRARAFALRDTFADVLKGLAVAEEVADYIDVTASVVAEETPTGLDAVTERMEAKRTAKAAAQAAPAKPPKPIEDDEPPFDVDPETGEVLHAEPEPKAKAKAKPRPEPEKAAVATGDNGKQTPLLGEDSMF